MTDNVLDILTCKSGDRWQLSLSAYCPSISTASGGWRLPAGDADYAGRWRMIKSRFSKLLSASVDTRNGRRKGERGIWQRRFWEHAIRDEDNLDLHRDYIHWNPVHLGER